MENQITNLLLNWRSVAMALLCGVMLLVATRLLLRHTEQRANRFFSVFLLSMAVLQLPQVLGFAGAYDLYPQLSFLPFNTELYLGPLVYMHAWTLAYNQPLRWRWYLLVPGLLNSIYFLSLVIYFPDYMDRWRFDEAVHRPIVIPILRIANLMLNIGCIAATVVITRQYKHFLQNNLSTADRFEPRWLTQLIIAILLAGSILVAYEIVASISTRLSFHTEYVFNLMAACVVAWLGIQVLQSTGRNYPKIAATPATPNTETGKNWQELGQELQKQLKQNHWFLEPQLSLSELSQRLASNESYVSRAINEGLGLNFNELVNSLRVEHAKLLLKQHSQSILDTATASGFNSKATFNRVFKATTGQTPSAFQKSEP